MEQPKTLSKLGEIQKEHGYETYRPYLGSETLARGERLEEMLPKLTVLRTEIEEYQKYMMEKRSELYLQAVAYLKSIGLPDFEYKGKKMTKVTPAYLNEINMALSAKYRYNDNYALNEISATENFIKKTLEKNRQGEKEKMAKEAYNLRYEAVFKTAEKYMTQEEVKIARVLKTPIENLENYLAEMYVLASTGEVIPISCCDECDQYTVGEHRCSCGNRRISVSAEGHVHNGEYILHLQTEAY